MKIIKHPVILTVVAVFIGLLVAYFLPVANYEAAESDLSVSKSDNGLNQLVFWYHPYFRLAGLNSAEIEKRKENFEAKITNIVSNRYPSIELKLKEISLLANSNLNAKQNSNQNAPDFLLNLTDESILGANQYSFKLEEYAKQHIINNLSVQLMQAQKRTGFPVLIRQQTWYQKGNLITKLYEGEDFINQLKVLPEASLLVNNNQLWQKQMTILAANENFQLSALTERNIINDFKIREFLREEKKIIAPVNLWMEQYLKYQSDGIEPIYLPSNYTIFTLEVYNKSNQLLSDKNNMQSLVLEIAREVNKLITNELRLASLQPLFLNSSN